MPPGPGQVPIELFEYGTAFGGIKPGSFSDRDGNKPYRSQRLVPLSFRAAGTDTKIARPLVWAGSESAVPRGGTANNLMGASGPYFICHLTCYSTFSHVSTLTGSSDTSCTSCISKELSLTDVANCWQGGSRLGVSRRSYLARQSAKP